MARNRALVNILGFILGIGIAAVLMFVLGPLNASIDSPLKISGFLVGGFIVGFVGYKNDGVRISTIFSIALGALGIIMGVLIASESLAFLGDIETASEAIFGFVIGTLGWVGGIFLIIAFVVAAISFIITAAIGSAIGNLVWRDKEKELETRGTYQVQQQYQPVQTQQLQTTQTSNSIFCSNCGTSNKGEDSFCVSCGAKLGKKQGASLF